MSLRKQDTIVNGAQAGVDTSKARGSPTLTESVIANLLKRERFCS